MFTMQFFDFSFKNSENNQEVFIFYSMSCNVWFYVGAVALAVAGTYVFWGPSSRPKKKKKGIIPGLPNLGNSCFLNAVLQALAACPSCINWLTTVTSAVEINGNHILIKALLSVLKALNMNDDFSSAVEVIDALRAHRWIISNEEQDAHELFHVLTATLEEELTSETVLSLLDAPKLKQLPENTKELPPKKAIVSSSKVTALKNTFPTHGLLVSELRCKKCTSKCPARYDTFDSISLVIPSQHSGQLTLHDLLQNFVSCETVQDVTCEFCSKQSQPSTPTTKDIPESKTTFTKQLSFGKLPKCLCIHIQRTMWLSNGLPVKCFDYIKFPEHLTMDYYVHRQARKKFEVNNKLGLTGGSSSKKDEQNDTNFCTTGAQIISKISALPDTLARLNSSTNINEQLNLYSYVYLLKAVIVHLGDTSSGHFITYRRGAANSQNQHKWFYTSDTSVREISFIEVSRSSAYMLFYEKMN